MAFTTELGCDAWHNQKLAEWSSGPLAEFFRARILAARAGSRRQCVCLSGQRPHPAALPVPSSDYIARTDIFGFGCVRLRSASWECSPDALSPILDPDTRASRTLLERSLRSPAGQALCGSRRPIQKGLVMLNPSYAPNMRHNEAILGESGGLLA